MVNLAIVGDFAIYSPLVGLVFVGGRRRGGLTCSFILVRARSGARANGFDSVFDVELCTPFTFGG